MIEPEQVAGIVKSLAKAQREAILRCRMNICEEWVLPTHRDRGRMRAALANLGICNQIGRLTILGVAVRSALKENDRG